MLVFVTGASGFVGRYVTNQLIENGHKVRCLVRPRSQQHEINAAAELHPGDILQPESLKSGLIGCDAAIHLVGIIRSRPKDNITFARLHVEATRNIVTATASAGIKRYLHMSANGVDSQLQQHHDPEGYLATKGHAEKIVRDSALDWTIFRPGLIYGRGGEFSEILLQQIKWLPMVPVIGDGKYQLMPVYVDDVARAFAHALTDSASVGATYHCCGPERCDYNKLIDLFAAALGKKAPFKLHNPLSIMRWLTRYLERFPAYPITSDQIAMLTGGNICPENNWYKALAIKPTPLAPGIKKALSAR